MGPFKTTKQMPSITAKVSPAQIQVLHSTLIESHPGTNEHQRQVNGPKLPSHVNELKFTETIRTVGVPVFGNMVNSIKSGTATISISEEQSTSNQEQKQNLTGSKVSFLDCLRAFISLILCHYPGRHVLG